MNVPLQYDDLVFGYLGVSVSKAFAADPEEAFLLSETAVDLGFALHTMEVEAARQRSERFLQTIFQTTSDGLLLAGGRIGPFCDGQQHDL